MAKAIVWRSRTWARAVAMSGSSIAPLILTITVLVSRLSSPTMGNPSYSFGARIGPTLRAFRSVLLQVQGSSTTGRDVQSVLAHYSGESPETAAMVTVGDYPTSVNADSVQRVANLMADFGMLSGPISVGFMTLP